MLKNSVAAVAGSLALFALTPAALAQIVEETITYEANGETFEGVYVRNTALGDSQPVVMIVHDWDGLTDYERERAHMLARAGYAAFAIDLFGEGVRPDTMEERQALTGELYGDRDLMRARLTAGAEQVAQLDGADADRVIAIGYCFGGAAVLEMARSGADADGFVSFHGGLGTPDGQDYATVTAPMLFLHGTSDPVAPMSDVADLAEALNESGVENRWALYGGVRHAFTVWGAGDYDSAADLGSWDTLLGFLDERW